MVSRYRQEVPPPRLPLWSLLDGLEKLARQECGPLAEDEAMPAQLEIEKPTGERVPACIVCLIRSALVGLPGPANNAEIYGHNPGREWEFICTLPTPPGADLAELLFAFAQKHWQSGGRL